MKSLKYIIISIAIIMAYSCNRNPYIITDFYAVYSEDEYGNGYYLMCKLGCDYDARIEFIKSIKWNKKHLIVQQEKPNQNSQWFIIKAKGEELLCCGRDTLIGPLTLEQMEKYSIENNLDDLKKKHF